MDPNSPIAALVLAAGRSTRMGSFKLLADLAGKPLLRHAVEVALGARVGTVIVVTGHEAASVAAALEGLEVRVVHNPNFADGLATSLASGIAAVPAACTGALVMLADMPHVRRETLDALIEAFVPGHVIVSACAGKIGNPILWPREAFAAMAGLTGDAGARRLLPRFEGRVKQVEVADQGIFTDVDTPEALAAARAATPAGDS